MVPVAPTVAAPAEFASATVEASIVPVRAARLRRVLLGITLGVGAVVVLTVVVRREPPPPREPPSPPAAPAIPLGGEAGRAVPAGGLVERLGCGACHPDAGDARAVRAAAPPFDGSVDYPAGFVFDYLARPYPVRTDIAPARMPDFRLDVRERLALALFVGDGSGGVAGAAAFERARLENPDVDRALGARIFVALNCAGCHRHPAVQPWAAGPPLAAAAARLDSAWLRGFLEEPVPVRPFGYHPGSGSRMPDFRLTGSEVDAVLRELATAAAARRGEADAGATDADATDAGATAEPAALAPWQRAEAEALLTRQLPCLGCHALNGAGGGIAPDLAGAADRLRPDALTAMIVAPQAAWPGTIMPPTPLPARVVGRVSAYLRSLDAGDVATPLSLADVPILLPRQRAGGPGLYRTYCAHCHGASGRGDGWNARFLPTPPTVHADSVLMAARSDDALFDAIHAGGRIMGRSARMPAFGGLLDASQIRDLVDYLRELCGCTGPEWAEDGRRGA